jgi:hypothetical protein
MHPTSRRPSYNGQSRATTTAVIATVIGGPSRATTTAGMPRSRATTTVVTGIVISGPSRGDDHGRDAAEPGDDHGGHGGDDEPGDDHGGDD